MTNGQISQMQELEKCYMKVTDDGAFEWLHYWGPDEPYGKHQKRWLRRLTHQYRHQIKAMKRNRK